ncbi:DUF4190 domain-containing protein [Streptomyces sp. NPDC052077]|uniref:DUF4190 domain-containing protein n=1 Tax=Streptomyces sp. NPDC052077 TaxID=3154757 RepID=UPI0034385AC7
MSTPPPPGPHGHYPQGSPAAPWGHPYGPPPPPEAPVNGVAIAALVLGILCFLPAVGLVLGIIALRQIGRRGERGKGLAVAGSVLSGVGIGLWAIALATGGAADFWEGFREVAGDRSGTPFTLSKGDCYNSPGGSVEGEIDEVDEVPCDSPHDAEVVGSFRIPGRTYPGDDGIAELADDRCYRIAETYAMDSWALPDEVDLYYLTPSPASWRLGDREVTCGFARTDAEPLTGSLRADETVLDEHQVAYLRAEAVQYAALDEMPEDDDFDEDPAAQRAWADGVADALAEQSETLSGHDWPAAADGPVAALVADLEKARKEWGRAASAEDADTFYGHEDNGWQLIDPEDTVTVREALGLATTPPDTGEDVGDGGDAGDGSGIEV